ncbi:DNA mismatch repair protein MutS [Parvicella tangerina]|uniref:DNA mismatch repair protein MutS n=1 Tax=Parvicella tangerina TaxID=2829795 RepID=A0A916JQW3_9FLAO|nr:DNA mismatch repair protein MutS [Parvicella tangerina]CAG5086982.1 DNA mismatch repair protein MutS [Parvicella tangerina]
MQQYNKIKAKYPEALLLFRVGDFYETFGQDAITAANILGIVLTARNNGSSKLELAGFPHHSLETYLPKLVRAGQRVAICDQLEDPKKTKKIVKRGVTELVTPGVAFNEQVLDQKKNNFLASIHFGKNKAGVAFLDVSTGEFLLAEGNFEYIEKLFQGFMPSEVLFQRNKDKVFIENFGDKHYTFRLDDWVFTEDFAYEKLLRHFGTKSLKGFGVEDHPLGVIAAGAILHYLSETQHNKVAHISSISRIEEDQYVWLDKFTIRNLEIIHSPNEDATTLIQVIDKTVSPMGGRLLKRWVVLPLKDTNRINSRLEIVEFFVNNQSFSQELNQQLNNIGDLERLISKVAALRISPRETVQLKYALKTLAPIKKLCEAASLEALQNIGQQINLCEAIASRLEKEIKDDAPVVLSKGGVIASGVNQELDDLRAISFSGKDYLLQMQQRLCEETGIPSLKIAFNNVFGYYIEVRNTHKDKVPENWVRKQTLTQAERYITEELKEYESKILGAEEKIQVLEAQLFEELVFALSEFLQPIQYNASLIAQLDCLLSFAKLAVENSYTKPVITNSKIIDIKEGRHPVIEQNLPIGEEYIANDVYLDEENQQIIMITGPNMSGKSALLRQTALIILMAQMGSFVPAKSATFGYVDKVFTRVGASDNISSGESTFMVEMNETASILNNISDRSLILLDEIGRGTSTYDGISIAWSIAEYLHQHPKYKAKTLFATHYHELNEMTTSFPRIKNFNVSVKELNKRIIFLRKLVEGGSEHSFGIHVAKVAGMPNEVVNRANKILERLEKSHSSDELSEKAKELAADASMQLSFFQLDDPVLSQVKDEIKNLDINTLTPVEALMKLNEIKKLVGG